MEWRRLVIEPLETRQLLSINVVGIPNWVEQGPRVILNAGSVVSPNNPATGAVQSIAVNPVNPMQVYVATVNGGIWRSNNADPANPGAITWTPLTDQQASLATSSIEFSPLDATGNTLFAGTGTFSNLINSGGTPIGILRTIDGGNTWLNFPVNLGNEPRIKSVLPTSIDLDPGAAVQQMVLVAGIGANGGIYRSDNSGETFSLLSGANGLPVASTTQLIVDPNNAARFYAALAGQGIFQGNFDGGTGIITWNAMNNGIVGADITSSANIQIAAHDDGANTVLYVGTADPPPPGTITGALTGVYRSTDNAANWSPLGTPPGFNAWSVGGSGFNLLADPTNNQVVYLGGLGGGNNLFRYHSGGPSWDLMVGAGAMNNTAPHADSRDMAFIGTNVLIETDDGGIYFMQNPLDSTNNKWKSFIGTGSQALGDTEMHNAAWDSVSNIITGGLQDNGTDAQQNSGSLIYNQDANNFLLGKDGGDVVVDVNTLAGANRSIRFFSSQNLGMTGGDPQGDFRRQVFNNANAPIGGFVEVLPAGGLAGFTAQFITPVEINAIAPTAAQLMTGQSQRIAVGGGSSSTNPVYESNDAGTAANPTWTAVPIAAGFGNISAIAYGGTSVGLANPDVLWVGDDNGVVYVRTTSGGMLNPTVASFPGSTVHDIVLDPNDWHHAFVVSASGVWETTDTGATWNTLTGSLANSDLQSVEFVENGAVDALLAGGLGGVFRMLTDNAGVWNEYGAGLPNAVAYDLQYNAADDVLLAATFGRGAWIVQNASATITMLGCLQITGDDNDNEMSLEADPINALRFIADDGLGNRQSFEISAFSKVQFFGLGGDDTIRIDSNGAAPGGSLDFVKFLVEVDGGAHNMGDQLLLDDSSSVTGATVTFTSADIGAAMGDTLFGSQGRLTYTAIESIDLNLSNHGGDTVMVESTSVPMMLHGNGGSDAFTVGTGDLTAIAAPVSIFGGDDDDSLAVDDSGRADAVDYYLDPTLIAICNSVGPPPMRTSIAIIDGTLETARLDATDGVNRFDLAPSATTAYTIAGNLPPPGTAGGDFLSIRFVSTTNRQLTYDPTTGNGTWIFDPPFQAIHFESIEKLNFFPVLAYSADAAAQGKPTVKVVDAETGAILSTFQAYEATYRGGVRVAVADVTGDGIPEIITAPGRNHAPVVQLFNLLTGMPLAGTSFHAFSKSFSGGVHLAVGDLDGDGLNDVAASPGRGKTEIRTFLNAFATTPTKPFSGNTYNRFLAFEKNFIGGATIALGDVRSDAKAEIIVGSGAGRRAEVRIFDGLTNGSANTPASYIRRFLPFDSHQRGGVWVAAANIDGGAKFELLVGAGVGGHSQVATYDFSNLSTPIATFQPFSGNGSNAPLRVAAADINSDGKSELFVAQGPDGRSQTLRRGPPAGPLVDFLMENDPEFHDGFFIAADLHAEAFLC
ncbi:MAG: hypothetical protein IT427_02255 [Pirellulales bacterium]|nr:hypothetical protein [Pirellulales bacterium]